jgi:hypothetical protein
MLSPAQLTKIMAFMPADLLGLTIKKIQPGQLSNNESYPLMVVSLITPGSKLMTPTMLRDEQDPVTKVWTTWWGQHNTCTASVKILHTDLAALQGLVYDFLIKAHSRGPGAFAYADQILFRGTDEPRYLKAFSDPKGVYKVHRASIDLFFRYEFAWERTSQPMRIFYHTITPFTNKGEDAPILLIDYIPGEYGMDLIISGKQCVLSHEMGLSII